MLALYDIHGNVNALEAVLADPAAAGADVVVIGGDVVPGPFAPAVLERLEPLEARWARADDEMVTRLSTPERWRAVLSTTDAKVVVAGHTHQQDDRRVGDVRFVNAGSVGLPYEGDGAARWLWVVDGVPYLRQTSYDHRAAGERMRNRWPDDALFVQSIEGALIEPVPADAVTEIFEGLVETSGAD